VLIVPLATFLFLGGVVFCYYISPRAVAFFFQFNESMGVEVELTLTPYLFFLMRLLLVFGIAFELPLVLTFLAAVGFVTKSQLMGWWRQAVLMIFIFAAIATPTTDPATMTFMAGPMVILYLLSVWLAGLFEKDEPEEDEEVEEPRPPTGGPDEVEQAGPKSDDEEPDDDAGAYLPPALDGGGREDAEDATDEAADQ
jgi:sec-independent protein translocase protein TatC